MAHRKLLMLSFYLLSFDRRNQEIYWNASNLSETRLKVIEIVIAKYRQHCQRQAQLEIGEDNTSGRERCSTHHSLNWRSLTSSIWFPNPTNFLNSTSMTSRCQVKRNQIILEVRWEYAIRGIIKFREQTMTHTLFSISLARFLITNREFFHFSWMVSRSWNRRRSRTAKSVESLRQSTNCSLLKKRMTIKFCRRSWPLTVAAIAGSATPRRWSCVTSARNGFATREEELQVRTSSIIWCAPNIARLHCTMKVHWEKLFSSATAAVFAMFSCWDSFQQKLILSLFCCAGKLKLLH